ncbi:MAG: hypothetical protein IAF08_16100 [Rhizobacter sp.]|nr:hypothetical protein [Chlorobiales bacterium]
MSKRNVISILCVALVAVAGCGKKADEAKTAMQAMKSMAESGEKVAGEVEKSEAKMEARRQKGDTLAIPYKDLQKYLPESIGGYTAEEPKGQTMSMQGMSYSTATRRYTQGESDIEVSLTDYNSAYGVMTSATMFMSLGITVDDDEQTTKGYDTGISGVKGYEELQKKSKNAKITLSVGDRFLLVVAATGGQENTEFVKGIAKSIKLSDLAVM